jgi:hypothetical protein
MYEVEQKLIRSKGNLSDFRVRSDQRIQVLQSEKAKLESKLIQVNVYFFFNGKCAHHSVDNNIYFGGKNNNKYC